MTKKTNKLFMAFASGSESTEESNIKRYIGIAPVSVLAVNPTKAELEAIYGRTLEKDIEYITEVEKDGVKTKQVRIDFIIATDPIKSGIDLKTKMSFFVRGDFNYNKDASKVQVIDKFGRTAWVTVEQAKNHEIPVYSNGPANLDADYRPCLRGEEDLSNFIKTYLNVASPVTWVDGKFVPKASTEGCEARLDKIAEYVKGNFTELKGLIKLQPNNKVKVLFGVKTTDDNKQYQTIYTQMVLKPNVTDYKRIQKEVEERQATGAMSNVDFSFSNLKEYDVTSTDFKADDDDPSKDLPFGNPWERK